MIPLLDDNPLHRRPFLTVALILVCVVVFAYQTSLPDTLGLDGEVAFTCEYGLVASHVVHGDSPQVDVDGALRDGGEITCRAVSEQHNRLLGLVTYQFLHADWLHLAGNMLFLWVFGNNIEDRLGRLRFVPFYLVCGVIAGLCQALTDASTDIPLVGASGAVSGLLGAYLLLFPRAGIWTLVAFVIPVKLPAWVWIGVYFAFQFAYLGDSMSTGGGDVAYAAHIGGFLAGLLLVRPFLAGRPGPPPPGDAAASAAW